MSDYEDDFFDGKRPWSVIKDQVLGSYMSPYLAKVKQLRKPILLIDGFAGPGVFEDGSVGSPLIMCQAADKFTKGNYQAFFFNKKPLFHTKLTGVLGRGGWLEAATPVLGDTTKLLPKLPIILKDQTVFLYLDPLGPTGCPFKLLEPFLTRDTDCSTEIVIMMHMPIAHRLAARKAVEAGREKDPLISKYHQTMDATFGGDYWKEIMLSPGRDAETRELELIQAYRRKLAGYLPYTGCCPVRESERDRIKYFIVFTSRHPDAMLLMNDAMMRAYHSHMHDNAYRGTIFEGTSWDEALSTRGLREAIVRAVQLEPGLTREQLWLRIVHGEFMRFRSSDFREEVERLVFSGALACPTPRRTRRLNDHCVLYSA